MDFQFCAGQDFIIAASALSNSNYRMTPTHQLIVICLHQFVYQLIFQFWGNSLFMKLASPPSKLYSVWIYQRIKVLSVYTLYEAEQSNKYYCPVGPRLGLKRFAMRAPLPIANLSKPRNLIFFSRFWHNPPVFIV